MRNDSLKFLLLSAWLAGSSGGCAPAKTPSEACRRQAAANRMGRSFAPDPRLDAIENIRCDEMEREERREAREDAREKAVAEAKASARADAMNAALDAKLAEIRAAPKVPELGATVAEAKIMCTQQRGAFSAPDDNGIYACRVGGPAIFICAADYDGLTTRCDGFFEGSDIAESRARIERDLGPADQQSIEGGVRVASWKRGRILVRAMMYDRGVRLSVAKISSE